MKQSNVSFVPPFYVGINLICGTNELIMKLAFSKKKSAFECNAVHTVVFPFLTIYNKKVL